MARLIIQQLRESWESYLAIAEDDTCLRRCNELPFKQYTGELTTWGTQPLGLSFRYPPRQLDQKSARASLLAGHLFLEYGVLPLAQRVLQTHARRLSSVYLPALTSRKELKEAKYTWHSTRCVSCDVLARSGTGTPGTGTCRRYAVRLLPP